MKKLCGLLFISLATPFVLYANAYNGIKIQGNSQYIFDLLDTGFHASIECQIEKVNTPIKLDVTYTGLLSHSSSSLVMDLSSPSTVGARYYWKFNYYPYDEGSMTLTPEVPTYKTDVKAEISCWSRDGFIGGLSIKPL